ncbi:MAG: hypothetical protein GY707_02625 [Desulfobacteraceae bacterium]|nr:hypothetical protein [Desulfobacteraceae bacterium]
MNNYQKQREWSDKYLGQIKNIVGPLMLEESSFEIDTQQATDLVMVKGKNKDIACRVRKPGYFNNFKYEFTVRKKNKYGYNTELRKIINGYADWAFYGHVNKSDEIHAWYVIDLNVFRSNLISRPDFIKLHRKEQSNKLSGDTQFSAFDIRSFTKNILIATNIDIEFFEFEKAA